MKNKKAFGKLSYVEHPILNGVMKANLPHTRPDVWHGTKIVGLFSTLHSFELISRISTDTFRCLT